MSRVPTIAEVEAGGTWVCAKNSNRLNPCSVFARWIRLGFLKDGDWKDELVRYIRADGRQKTEPVRFYRCKALQRAAHASASDARRSRFSTESMRQRWGQDESFKDERGMWLRIGRAAKRARCGVPQIRVWLTKGSRYLDGARLSCQTREVNGLDVVFVLVSELDRLIAARAAVPAHGKHPGMYSLAQTAKKIGVKEHTLHVHDSPFGLTKVKLPKYSSHVAKRSGKQFTVSRSVHLTYFHAREVDDFIRRVAVRPDEMTVAEAARKTVKTVRTIHNWCVYCPHLGRGLRYEERDVLTATGVQSCLLVSRADVLAIKKAMRTGKPVTDQEEQTLAPSAAPIAENLRPVNGTQAAESPPQGARRKGGRPRTDDTEELMELVYTMRQQDVEYKLIQSQAKAKLGIDLTFNRINTLAKLYAERHGKIFSPRR